MNSNIIEIVTILVQKLIHNEDVQGNEEEIIQGLLELGYDLNEIEIAFELIFSSTEIIGVTESFENLQYLPHSVRILSRRERLSFSDQAQRALLEMIYQKLLSDEELEDIIQKASSVPAVEAGVKELWYLVKTSITDRLLLARIKRQIDAFKDLIDGENLYVH